MDIREIQSAPIAGLLSEEKDNLIPITFKSTVDISSITKIIEDCVAFKANSSSTVDDANPIDTASIIEQIANAYDGIKKCPEHSACFEDISSIANKLGENINNVFNVLSSVINPEVENLIENIKTKMNDILVANKNEIVINEKLDTSHLRRLVWATYLNVLGGIDSLVNSFNAIYGHEPTYQPADLNYALTHTDLNIESMQIHPETRAAMLNLVLAKAGNAEQKQSIMFLFDTLTDPFRFNELVNSTIGSLLDDRTMSKGLQAICRAIETLYPVVSLFRNTTFDITDEMADVINRNIDRLESLFKIMGIAIAIARYNYKDALMIDVDLINVDNEDKFHEAGGTDEDIVKFMRTFYNNPERFTLPTVGVSVDEIVGAKKNVNERYDLEEQSKLKNAAMIQHSALIQATNEVMEQYLVSIPNEKIPANEDRDTFLRYAVNKVKAASAFIMSDGDNNLSSVLFNIIIDLFYHDTILGTAHEMFGEELIKQVELNSDVDENVTSMIDVTVASRIISKFLVDHIFNI